jgi:hypothetical protein
MEKLGATSLQKSLNLSAASSVLRQTLVFVSERGGHDGNGLVLFESVIPQ